MRIDLPERIEQVDGVIPPAVLVAADAEGDGESEGDREQIRDGFAPAEARAFAGAKTGPFRNTADFECPDRSTHGRPIVSDFGGFVESTQRRAKRDGIKLQQE